MSRLALSDTDKQARDWFRDTTTSLGCTVKVDEMGNQFAIRPGKKQGLPTCAGSHLDTQPAGGRYDGILGVTAAVEMLRVLQEEHVETEVGNPVLDTNSTELTYFAVSCRCHKLDERGRRSLPYHDGLLRRLGWRSTARTSPQSCICHEGRQCYHAE